MLLEGVRRGERATSETLNRGRVHLGTRRQVPEIEAEFYPQKALTGQLKSRRVPAEKRDAESCLEVGPLPCLKSPRSNDL